MTVHTNLASLTREQLEAMVAKLAANQSAPKQLSCKVGEKGGLSVYGLGRFPVSLYKGQWQRLIEFMPTIEAFIAANGDQLSEKPARVA